MGRAPCCDKANVKRGPWSPEEDALLKDFIEKNGTGGNWISLPQKAGLKRCGKSCRLRWLNYLRPNIKHGDFSDHEDRVICTLYSNIGSRWSIIAAQLPGRTDNDIKNYWNTKLKKKLMNMAMIHHPQPKLQPTPGLSSIFQFNPSIPSSPISAATSSSSSSSSSSSLFSPTYHSNNNAMPFAEPVIQPFSSPNLFQNYQQAGLGFEGYTNYCNNGDNISDYGLEELKELISSSAATSSNGSFLFEEHKSEPLMYY